MQAIIRYDLINGSLKRAYFIIIPVVTFGMSCLSMANTAQRHHASLGEYLAVIMSGSGPTDGVAFFWFLIQLGCLYFTLDYPSKDLNSFGRQIIIRCGSKAKWWMSKCVWNFVSVLVYWITGLLTVLIFAVIFGFKLDLGVRTEALYDIFSCLSAERNFYLSNETAVVLIITPFLAMLAVNLIQMLIGLFSNQIAALISGIFVLFMSIRFMLPLLPANYCMVQRSSLFLKRGLNYIFGILILAFEIAALIAAGLIAFRYADILECKKIAED